MPAAKKKSKALVKPLNKVAAPKPNKEVVPPKPEKAPRGYEYKQFLVKKTKTPE